MTAAGAAEQLVWTLRTLNRRELTLGGQPITGGNRTLQERATETMLRIDLAANAVIDDTYADPMPLLEAAGAHLLALMVAVDEAQRVRVDTGDAA